ncbi:MAG TPA: cytochrome c oxidase subunit II [Gemmatimonadaceae bacterium]|nr:cytochrome c oxidase subunit II [Gemmatimonadaceae bacterium]
MSRRALPLASALLLAGCDYYERQSMLHAAGPQAERAETLWWFLFWTAAVVWVAVTATLLWAAFHRRRPAEDPVTHQVAPEVQRTMARAVVSAVGVTTLILFAFLFASFRTGRAVTIPPAGQPLTIEVTGHQWWWEVQYADTNASRRLTTANEIHIPVGRPVILKMSSPDVIHSLWIPNLAGKRDLIPGKVSTMWLRADSAGIFRGQCAEFCGHQHAKMALFVVAEPPERWAAWYERQLQPAPQFTDSVLKRGGEVFMASACVMCHAIDGTPAGSNVGPNLTHIGSRLTIGAGTLPNARGNLAGWILDPQRIKPGANMPPNQIAPQDLQALLGYLESLR